MLEGLVAWVLNNYLGKYVENLNTDQLSVALLSGKVELENLPLKKDALRHLGLPVEIKAGFIGKVQLQVPVRQIRSAPWLIAIEKLYLVAAPVNLDEWDSEVEAVLAHERKVALLDALEAQWRAEHEAAAADAGYYAASYSSWLSYGTGLLANIVENLQLTLSDVHVRYEDALTCAPYAFACGLTVQSLAAASCDAEWRRGFTLLPADGDGCSFKLLELQQLAVYWDPMPVPGGMLADCTVNELTERMSETWKSAHRYIVSPASATARVRRERTEQPLRSRTRPRVACHLTLDTVQLDLSSRQYNEAVGCALGLQLVARLREFRALRPAVPVRGHARLWWLYALRCQLPHLRWTEPRPSWESCLEAARLARQYVHICLGLFANPAATLPPDKKAAKDDYEWRTPLHQLKALREVAMRMVPEASPAATPEQPASSGRSMLVRWFPQWWGWYGAPPAAPAPEPTDAEAPAAPGAPRLEDEILDVIADSLENNTMLKRDTVFGKFEFTLNKGSLDLCMDYPQPHDAPPGVGAGAGAARGAGLELQFSRVCVRVESRPRAGSHALHVSLGALCLRERITPDTLFPVLVAPHGVIREGLSAMNAAASTMAWCRARAAPPAPPAPPGAPPAPHDHEPLFHLLYEKKPFNLNCDYKLWVKSGSLEVVWCGAAARWAQQFLYAPWRARGRPAPRAAVRAVRDHTRATLIDHWEHMMHPHLGERRSWQVELDISAPQILLVQALCDRDAAVLVVDFGRLRLANAHLADRYEGADGPSDFTGDDEEMFMTPCSTPPGSLLSPESPPAVGGAGGARLDAAGLRERLYERYALELSELQVLVGRAHDNWKYAHTKPTSSLHLLDRFTITLQAERRVVRTADPQYPTATLRGTLPALVVHLSEHKLAAVRSVLHQQLQQQQQQQQQHYPGEAEAGPERAEPEDDDGASVSSETERSERAARLNATLYVLQFAVDQLSLEVQSRGRSIAEVQVCGVRAALAARPADTALSLSVHSLLLVDALQTHGPDYELLVASHKHVGMDTASGSIRGSEPTSPTSPASPAGRAPPAPPHALQHAVYSLFHNLAHAEPRGADAAEPERARSPAWEGAGGGAGAWGVEGCAPVDSEALIAVELVLVRGGPGAEELRIANILFNNLDIIANQETIVELIGFVQRVMGAPAGAAAGATAGAGAGAGGGRGGEDGAVSPGADPADQSDAASAQDDDEELTKQQVRTEITFDFHRLGVLLLRAAAEGGAVRARKVATATVTEARIQATLDPSRVEVSGSLGGVQVVSLCGAGGAGPLARVLSVGSRACAPHDPLKALRFEVSRRPAAGPGESDAGPGPPLVLADVRVHVASVWYTHSPPLLRELRSCLSEFKQYLANLARSIRAAAHDMALGLVHPRGESLYVNPKLSQSTEGVSPRRRTTSLGCSLDDPPEIDTENIVLSVSVELESPVVVLGRAAGSAQVAVAHLGRMSLANRPGPPDAPAYRVRVRDISLVTLDVSDKLRRLNAMEASMEQIYEVSCGKPVLHDTALQLSVAYCPRDAVPLCEVSGAIVGGLHVSACRAQYEQVLETLRALTAPPPDLAHVPGPAPASATANVDETDNNGWYPAAVGGSGALAEPAVPTLRLDPALRAAVLAVPPPHAPRPPAQAAALATPVRVKFAVPQFTVELRADLGAGERSLVQLACREFALHYDTLEPHATALSVSLHSITMEDLTKEPESRHRMLMVSHTPQVPPKAVFVSTSCPDLPAACAARPRAHPRTHPRARPLSAARADWPSLPAQLNVLDREMPRSKRNSKCSPEDDALHDEWEEDEGDEWREGAEDASPDDELRAAPGAGAGTGGGPRCGDDNLVRIEVRTRDPRHPHYEDKYDKVSRATKVDFNCLNLVVSIDSWVAVLDFFGVAGDEEPAAEPAPAPGPAPAPPPAPHAREDTPVDTSSTHVAEEGVSVSQCDVVTQTEMSIRSLRVVLVGRRGEVCGARVSRVAVVARARVGAAGAGAGGARSVRGRLGALAVADLAPRPHPHLWRDRFRTHGKRALTFRYQRLSAAEAAAAGHETSVSVEIGPATYVHTRRFVHALQAYVRDFSRLRSVLTQARHKVSVSGRVGGGAGAAGGGAGGGAAVQRQRVSLVCAAPVIVVPVSGAARLALLARLAALRVDNSFRRAGDDAGTLAASTQHAGSAREWLDVRRVRLEGLSLRCARGGRGLRVRREGPPLLPAPAHLELRVEHNLSDTHNVPDMTIHGTLTTLECVVEPAQYRVLRGVLAHNLAECVDDLLAPEPAPAPAPAHVWRVSSLALQLHDVRVRLRPEGGGAELACINFIKSRLLVENYSDLSQDIDLVSQEILVSDTRYAREPANRRGNVFSHIVQPMPDHPHSVQAEVHARKRGEWSAYTVLVNNMRLMAVLDWWEAAHQFLAQPPPPSHDHHDQRHHPPEEYPSAPEGSGAGAGAGAGAGQVEVKLNVTDSQLVLVEDASVWDTNAVILKSTTVVQYRSGGAERPVSCELSELEVFSCVLGLEEETALSILDPARLTVALHADRVLHVTADALRLRLSYHDMRMFASMLRSLPAQARAALHRKITESRDESDAPANSVHMGAAGGAAGGAGGALRWAARASPAPPPPPATPPPPAPDNAHVAIWPLKAVQVRGECVTLCVIDDCLDSDVPLLELALADLRLDQDLRKVEESFEDPLLVSTPGEAGGGGAAGGEGGAGGAAGGGRLSAQLSVDYYNRMLSGWEPVVEPWRFETSWEYTMSSRLSLARLQARVASRAVLCTSVTSALIDLCQLVRANWAADYYAPQTGGAAQSPKGAGSPAGHRRRSPFVPYALRNHTGHRLWFTTLLTTSDVLPESSWGGAPDDSWVQVRAGDTEPFSFGERRARAVRGAAPQPPGHTLHQLALALDGWTPPDPVCVDRVGVFFRTLTHVRSGVEARVVLEVSLEGSARKLVTVRSALRLLNRLPHAVEVRVEQAPHDAPYTHSTHRTHTALHTHAEWCVAAGVGAGAAAARARVSALRPLLAPRGLAARPPGLRLHLHYPLFFACAHWGGGGVGRSATVEAGEAWAAPLAAQPGALWVRPLLRGAGPHTPAPAPLHWRDADQHALLHAECRAPRDHNYRFCCVIVRERFPAGAAVAGHTLTLVPALRLENLLPLELQYRADASSARVPPLAAGALPAGDTRPFHEVNVEEGVELSVKLEGFAWSSPLSVGGGGAGGGGGGAGGGGGGASGSFSARLKLRDVRGRRLYLNARVAVEKNDGIKVSISAAYWLVNRTGLPLVFRAEGGAQEAAGQFDEHEVARMVAPLLFSFAEADGGPTLCARVGRGARLPGTPEWCSPFGLGPGIAVKKLEVRGAGGGGGGGGAGADRVYALGVSVRAGRGRYRHTNIVTFTPRYQLHNNTSHHLQFAQKCTATTLNDPGALATHVSAVAGCYLPWHWPRWDRERLLCVRVLAPSEGEGAGAATQRGGAPAALTAWSGGFRVEAARSLHVACREPGGGYRLVRVEVASQGATLFVVLTDAECAPPPLRIENRSPVAIMFHQLGCSEECVVGAHASVQWALPEPEGAAALALRAPGGPRTALPLDALDTVHTLLYQNFIYVVFTATTTGPPAAAAAAPAAGAVGPEGDEQVAATGAGADEGALVLEVPLGSTRVVLGRKRYGDRSQLWRRGPNDQLIHEGSSPPQPTDAHPTEDAALSPHAMVLDIEGPAPRPGRPAALVLRRADGRRASTQAWRVLPPGRMACAHANLCVQPDGGLMALAPGSRVVLALQETSRRAGGGGGAGDVPAEQAVAWHTLRPGSGRLDVALTADGPTRLVRIHDHKEPEAGWAEGAAEGVGGGPARREWGLLVSLAALSVSLVSRAPAEELVHALLEAPRLQLAVGPRAAHLELVVRDMQWDNQLLGTPSPVLLHCLGGGGGGAGELPALHAAAELLHAPSSRYNAHFFRHLVIALRPIAVRLEERLILKVWAWAAAREPEAHEQPDEAEYETRRMLDDLTALHATRYYFALIKIIPSQIRLSMYTANKLEGSLGALKRRLGLTLIRFEDAAVELEPFVRAHHFDTGAHLARSMLKHFKDELKWQAAKILGSVDFLGNPLGFVADVSEGVSGLILEGNVGALLKNVTHGISNSAAKVTESLGDGLERVVSDEAHEETRRRIRSAAAGAHLAAGLRGLGLGLLGGVTSLVKHSYEGATQEGLPGFLAGVGKGLVGTVTKPVIGVLDLAAETASALRDTSRRPDRWAPERRRPPRCAAGPGGLLPRYCAEQAAGAALLYALNGADYSEGFLAYRIVRDSPHDIRALLSTRTLRIFTCKHAAAQPQVVMETQLGNLVSCAAVSAGGAHFVELGVRGAAAEGVRRPRVQCDSAELAAWVARHAAYARRLHHEALHTLQPHDT